MAKKKELAFEESIDNKIIRARKDAPFVPEPPANRLLNVGDEVIIGCLQDCKVQQIVDNGKFYVISYTRQNNDKLEPSTSIGCWPWTDIRRKSNSSNSSFVRVDKDLELSYSQRQLDGLLTMVYHFGVDFAPEYQRDFVWEQEQKDALIDSIFHGVDIGKFVFVHNGYYTKYGYEILDGKQRLKTLCEFYESRFPYKGVYFNEMSSEDRNYFKYYSVSYAEYREISREQRIKAFVLLNTSGIVVDRQQIEYAKNLYKEATGSDFE